MGKTVKICFIIFGLFAVKIQAKSLIIPSLKGITNVQDTSYNNYVAFKNSIKSNPEVILISVKKPDSIIEKRNITYASISKLGLQLDAFYQKSNIYSEVHTFENAPHSFCLLSPWFEPTVSFIYGFLKKIF